MWASTRCKSCIPSSACLLLFSFRLSFFALSNMYKWLLCPTSSSHFSSQKLISSLLEFALQEWSQAELKLLYGRRSGGFSLTASAPLLFSSWTWCIAVFTRPAWLINSPLQGLFINCLCWFYNEDAIFRDGHFHNTCIFLERRLFCFVEEFWFVFLFLFSAWVQSANSFCSPLSFDWFKGCSWSDREEQRDKSKPLLIYYV